MTSELRLTAKALADKAAKEAAAAKAKAELLERESAEAGAKFQAQAGERRQQFMKAWLAEFDDEAAGAALIAAKADLEAAALADPVMKAYLELCRLYKRRGDDGQIAANFAAATGVPAPRCDAGHDLPTASYLMQWAMEHKASLLEGERVAKVHEALDDAAANGEDDGS